MRSELNLVDRTPVVDPQQTESPGSDAGSQAVLEQALSDVRRTRQRLDRHIEGCETGFRRVYILSAIIALTTLGLIGAAWYGYSNLNQLRPLMADIPGLQKLMGSMGDRLASLETGENSAATDRTSLTERIAKLETNVNSNVKAARTQAQAAAAQMGQGIRQELGHSLGTLQRRVEGVESVQRETQDHVSQLQTEIGGLHQQVAGLQEQSQQQLNELRQAAKTDMDRMNGQMNAHANRLSALDNQVGRRRVPFELADNQTDQIAPGIYVTVKHTDVDHQKVDGWMQLSTEGRILWIRGLDAQQPFTFVTRADSRPQELVFTTVSSHGAAGYVLVPPTTEAAATPSSSVH